METQENPENNENQEKPEKQEKSTTIKNIEAVEILIRHGKYLLCSLDYVHTKILNGSDNLLGAKEIQDLVKAVRDEKTLDQTKFPHLSQENIKKYGQALRQSYSILKHYKDFQFKAQKLLVDIFNECRDLDLSWNYVFTLQICRLFTLYVKLAVFITQMNDVGRIPIVYDYCWRMVSKQQKAAPSELITYCKDRSSFIKLNSELQFSQKIFFGLFKGIITIMYRLLNAGLSYDWSYLNISDNPSEFEELDPEFPFFKPEYVVMIHLEDICECFTSYVISNYSVIGTDQQFQEVMLLILAHMPHFHMHGNTSFVLYKILEDMRKLRNKKSESNLILPEKKEEVRRGLLQTRQYRCRKLAMILEEILNSYSVEKDVLCSKLIIIEAALGFSHYTASSLLNSFHEDNDKLEPKFKSIDVIPLIYRMTQIIILMVKNFDDIKRFLVFNLREYDAPYLKHLILSFNIPKEEYNRFATIIDALQSINIEEFDNGQKYDLSGLALTLKRSMASFNKFSTKHGILHLAPLFNFISALFFRTNTYNAGEKFFIEICPINTYWIYIPIFKEMANLRDSQNASFFPAILTLTHFYSLSTDTVAEFPEFPELIQKHADDVMESITNSVFIWAKSLQDVGMQQLLNQTAVSTILAKNDINEKASKRPTLEDTKPGVESQLGSRPILSPIHTKLSLISDTFVVFREIGKICVFGKEIDVFKAMNSKLAQIMVKLFDNDKVLTPFQLKDKLQNTRFVISYIMTAARVDPGPIIFECMRKLTNAPIEENKGLITIKTDELGKLSQIYVNFFSTFFKDSIKNSYYSTSSQSFINLYSSKKDQEKFKADVIQVFASKSSIRTIKEILTVSGIACIDIIAADTIASLYQQLVQEIKSNISETGELLFTTDPFNLPNAKEIASILGQIGAISKYRQLLRSTIPQEEAVDQYSFLASNVTPETDTILLSRLRGRAVIKIFKAEWFPSLIYSIFCTPHIASIKYNIEQDAFIGNIHLMGLAIDNVIGAIVAQDTSFRVAEFYTKLVNEIHRGIINGKENVLRKTVEHWNTSIYLLILDHLTKTSFYLDYSILEQVLPYKLIRSIYTRVLSSKK